MRFARHSGGVLGVVAKGWQLSGITSIVSGLPLRVTASNDADPPGIGILSSSATRRPDMIADPNKNSPHTIAKWFNTEAFANVPAGVIRPGNTPATSVIGPGWQRFDATLSKEFLLRKESNMRLQFRAEAFNLPNHTNYQGVSTGLGSSNYGQITSTREARRIQLALKLLF